MKRVGSIVGVAAVLVIGLAIAMSVHIAFAKSRGGVHAGSVATVSGAEVKIDNFAFTPATLTVKAGTEVTWINRDDIPHTVVGDDQAMKSKALDTDDKFTFAFTKAGTYTYFCSLHPKMKGKVVVE